MTSSSTGMMATAGEPAAEEDPSVTALIDKLRTKQKQLDDLIQQRSDAEEQVNASPPAAKADAPAAADSDSYVRFKPGLTQILPPCVLLYSLRKQMSTMDLCVAALFMICTFVFGGRLVERIENSQWRRKLRAESQAVTAQVEEMKKKEAEAAEKRERREADPPSARRARAGSTKKPKKQD